jgi:hypothetical protein
MLIREITDSLPPQVARAFAELGEMQRGEPEILMVRAQHAMGGGVMNWLVEHVGDLIHRMSHAAPHGYFGINEVERKVKSALRTLRHGYGVGREHEENMRNNAEHRGLPLQKQLAERDSALRAYTEAHKKLPVYNRLQWLARQSAIAIGERDFRSAETWIAAIDGIIESDRYEAAAREHSLGPDGRLQQYPYPAGRKAEPVGLNPTT